LSPSMLGIFFVLTTLPITLPIFMRVP